MLYGIYAIAMWQMKKVQESQERVVEEWEWLNQTVIDSAIREWRFRLRACVRTTGKHFEHKMVKAQTVAC